MDKGKNAEVARLCYEAHALEEKAERALRSIPAGLKLLDAYQPRKSERTRGPFQEHLRAVARRAGPSPAQHLLEQADARYWSAIQFWDRLQRRRAAYLAMRWSLETDDVYQIIRIGWYIAALRFDPDRGVSLATAARSWTRVTFQRSPETLDGGVKVPWHRRDRIRATVNSLDAPRPGAQEGEEWTYQDFLLSSGELVEPHAGRHPEHPSDWKDIEAVRTILPLLPERERHAISLRYLDLDDASDEELDRAGGLRGLQEVGDLLGGISKERVRQIEKRALERIRKLLAAVPTLHAVEMAHAP